MFRFAPVALLMPASLVLAGCVLGVSPSPRPSSRPAPLLTVERTGGLCVEGPCDRIVEIDTAGTVAEILPRQVTLGRVGRPLLERLSAEMSRTDFSVLEARPFVGVCPTAYDGQETTYTFHLASGDEVVPSCKVAIEATSPLFVAADAALLIDR